MNRRHSFSPIRLIGSLLLAALLTACSSAPKLGPAVFDAPTELQSIRDEQHLHVDRYLDAGSLARARSLAPPQVRQAAASLDPAISAAQADLVLNRAARDLCQRLASYFLIESDLTQAELRIELQPIAMRATGRGAAGVSAVVGIFVPGPLRLPAGLGGLAMATRVSDSANQSLLVEHWSRGANAVTDSAQISSIGDAYQLAGTFAKDLARVMIDAGFDPPEKRERLAKDQIRAGRQLCKQRFGSASVAGRGASILLPLAPEAIDEGASAGTEVSVGDNTKDQ